MRSLKPLFCAIFCSLLAVNVVGCGRSTDPAADIPPEKLAPAAEKLGDNPEYAEQMKNQ